MHAAHHGGITTLGSFLRKGEVLAYVGRIHNLKDLKDSNPNAVVWNLQHLNRRALLRGDNRALNFMAKSGTLHPGGLTEPEPCFLKHL